MCVYEPVRDDGAWLLKSLAPQQAIDWSLALIAQVWEEPALIAVNLPAGGLVRPLAGLPQQTID